MVDCYNPSLVLVQPRKIRPCLTEILLMERKESNQTNKQIDTFTCIRAKTADQGPVTGSIRNRVINNRMTLDTLTIIQYNTIQYKFISISAKNNAFGYIQYKAI